jgi:hypothetical protein
LAEFVCSSAGETAKRKASRRKEPETVELFRGMERIVRDMEWFVVTALAVPDAGYSGYYE